jgi:hypothetical protein
MNHARKQVPVCMIFVFAALLSLALPCSMVAQTNLPPSSADAAEQSTCRGLLNVDDFTAGKAKLMRSLADATDPDRSL